MQAAAFRFEVKRKIFHLYSVILPISYLFIPKLWVVTFLFLLTAGTLYLDISRHYNNKIKDLTNKFFQNVMRDEEESGLFKLSGASYMALGFFLTALFFSKGLAITAWLVLILSDCLAALVGSRIGKPLSNGKSLEGAAAFFSSSMFISMICYFFIGYNTSFSIIVLSCALTTLLEFYSKELRINDNLLIPVSYGLFTVICSFVAGL